MPSKFNAMVRARMEPKIETTFAEQFILTPMTRRPNGRREPDSERVTTEATGVFSAPSERTGVELGNRNLTGRSNDLRSIVNGRHYRLSVAADAFGEPADGPRIGDMVELIDQVGQPEFEIVRIDADGDTRIVLHLVSHD